MGEQKYEINKTVLKEFYEELMALEDWIPFEIKSSLPLEISMKLGSKVKNKDLWWNKIMEHQRANPYDDYYDYINWEIESFLSKYPYFKPLFIVLNNSVENIQ